MPEAIFNLVFMLFTIGATGRWQFAHMVHSERLPDGTWFTDTTRTCCAVAGFNSYIIGTITLVVMKGDERTGHYRRCANNLKQYSKVNSVPKVQQKYVKQM